MYTLLNGPFILKDVYCVQFTDILLIEMFIVLDNSGVIIVCV